MIIYLQVIWNLNSTLAFWFSMVSETRLQLSFKQVIINVIII